MCTLCSDSKHSSAGNNNLDGNLPMEIESPFVLFLLIPFFFLILFKLLKPRSSNLPLPPGPTPWPFIGNLLQLGRNPLSSITHFSSLHGPLISLRLGSQLAIVASSPTAASQILRTHDRILSARYIFQMTNDTHKLSQFSLLFSPECDDHWKLLRTTCRTHLFTPKALHSQASLGRAKISAMVEYLGSKTGEPAAIRDVAFTTVFNTLTNVIFSKDLMEFEGDGVFGFKEHYRKMMELCLVPNLADFYPFLSGLDVQGLKRKVAEYSRRVDLVYDAFIAHRRRVYDSNGGAECGDFLDSMIHIGFCDEQIKHLISELLSAGTDTTSTTVEWAMAELMKNKHIMNKVQEEIRREIKDQNVAIDESIIPQLHYLQACVKETLRLHPPAPLLLPHKALQTCEVMGYTIPKDTRIFVNIWAIGSDPTVWENPSMFDPDRFLRSDIDFKGSDFRYLPFGSGRRICPGLPMGVLQVNLILATFIGNFDWSLPNNEDPSKLDLSGKMGITYHKEEPLFLVPAMKAID